MRLALASSASFFLLEKKNAARTPASPSSYVLFIDLNRGGCTAVYPHAYPHALHAPASQGGPQTTEI